MRIDEEKVRANTFPEWPEGYLPDPVLWQEYIRIIRWNPLAFSLSWCAIFVLMVLWARLFNVGIGTFALVALIFYGGTMWYLIRNLLHSRKVRNMLRSSYYREREEGLAG